MIFGLVSQRAHADMTARALAAEAMADQWRQQFEAMFSLYVETIRPTVAPVVAPLVAPTTPAPRAKSRLAERIREESGGDPKIAAHFWNYARELRAEKKSDDEIEGMIGWTSDDPMEAVTA